VMRAAACPSFVALKARTHDATNNKTIEAPIRTHKTRKHGNARPLERRTQKEARHACDVPSGSMESEVSASTMAAPISVFPRECVHVLMFFFSLSRAQQSPWSCIRSRGRRGRGRRAAQRPRRGRSALPRRPTSSFETRPPLPRESPAKKSAPKKDLTAAAAPRPSPPLPFPSLRGERTGR
jgi:hypothetical protein